MDEIGANRVMNRSVFWDARRSDMGMSRLVVMIWPYHGPEQGFMAAL